MLETILITFAAGISAGWWNGKRLIKSHNERSLFQMYDELLCKAQLRLRS